MVTANYEQPCHRPRYETYAHVRPSTYRGNENGDIGGKKIGVPPKSLEKWGVREICNVEGVF